MNVIRRMLRMQLMEDVLVAKIVQVIGYVVGLAVLVLATVKLTKLPLSETELFFGILLVMTATLLMICAATLIRIDAEVRHMNDRSSSP